MRYIRENTKLQGKTVLLRADLDAPFQDGKILNDHRIQMALPTINYLHERGAKVMIISKLGRPKGWDQKQSLLPVAERLADLLKRKLVIADKRFPEYEAHHVIFFRGDLCKQENIDLLKNAPQKDIIILENIRFYSEEENLGQDFAKKLASIGDVYVNDAFAMAHRNETSVSLLPKFLPAYAGLNLEQEIKAMNYILKKDEHPFILIMGGIKISDKIGTIKNLAKSADHILVGGGIANLFFSAKDLKIGKSLSEKDQLNLAEDLLRNYKQKIVMPIDIVVAQQDYSAIRVCKPGEVKDDESIYDIGPQTIGEFSSYIKSAKKMVWNGPLGFYENKPFSHGTISIAQLFASKCQNSCYGLVGGGDTVSAVYKAGVADQVDFVSTGGSAMLDYLAGESLPGIKALAVQGN